MAPCSLVVSLITALRSHPTCRLWSHPFSVGLGLVGGGVSAGHSPVHSCLSSLPRLAYDQWLCVPCSLSASSSPVYSPRGAPSLSTVVSKLTMCWSVGICGLKSCGGTPAGVLQPPTWWWPMDDLPSRHPRPKVLFPVRTGSFCSVINSG